MILKELNQPSNYLISRLGLYNSWQSEFNPLKFGPRPSFAALFSSNFLNLVFKNGLIFLSHPQRSPLFFRVGGFYPLPLFVTVEDMYKFYRLYRVKAKIFKTYKTTFILRKFFKKLIFNSIRLYSLNTWTLVVGSLHVPGYFKLGAAARLSNLNLLPINTPQRYSRTLVNFKLKSLYSSDRKSVV